MKMVARLTLAMALVLMVALGPGAAAQAAVKKVTITFNANGGTIGKSKTKTVKKVTKGKRLGKLPAATRDGYALRGWYTKKTGGKKVTSKTKATKKAAYYARWRRTATDPAAKLLGTWAWNMATYSYTYAFNSDGTFAYVEVNAGSSSATKGNYTADGEKITFTNVVYDTGEQYIDSVHEYQMGTDADGEYLLISAIGPGLKPYIDLVDAIKYRRP